MAATKESEMGLRLSANEMVGERSGERWGGSRAVGGLKRGVKECREVERVVGGRRRVCSRVWVTSGVEGVMGRREREGGRRSDPV